MSSVFQGDVLAQTIGVANKHGIEPEALLAVVQVESAGKSLEIDKRTPCLLFERHIFYRELKRAGKLDKLHSAIAAGLANDEWQPATQYKDQNTSAKRLELFSRASLIDDECAIRSCSWGVGQTMGFLAEEMKFQNAKTMLSYMISGGVPAQVDCMVREIERKNLTPKLNAHDWSGFARIYNGPGYLRNQYDTKMAEAWDYWKNAKIPTSTPASPVRVPPNVQPSGPVTPQNNTKTAAGSGAAAGILAGIAAFFQNLDPRLIAFIVFIVLLGVVTAVIVWKRHRDAQVPQLGVLSSTMET